MPRRMSRERELMLLREYRAWDPLTETFEQLAARMDVSRQTYYNVLDRNNEPRRGTTGVESPAVDVDNLFGRLIEELGRKERRIAELEAELAKKRR